MLKYQSVLLPSLLLAISLLCSETQAQDSRTASGLDPNSKLPYLFGIPGNAIFGVIWILLSFVHFYHTYRSKVKWTLVLPIAEVFSSLGYFIRIACRSHQDSIALYAVTYLFIVLSPAAFLAFNYMMFSRLIISLDVDLPTPLKRTTKSKFTILPPRVFAPLFVGSDIITFLIQAGGGGLQASGGSLASTGNTLFLIGVIAQAVSYILFIGLLFVSHMRLRKEGISRAVTLLFGGLYFASCCILIRLFFRIVESSEGYNGKLYTTETYLFCLDALPLVLANLTWVFLWPPRYMAKDTKARQGLEKGTSAEFKA